MFLNVFHVPFSWIVFYLGSFKIAFSAMTPSKNGSQYSLRLFFDEHAFVHFPTHFKKFSFLCLPGRNANKHEFCSLTCFLWQKFQTHTVSFSCIILFTHIFSIIQESHTSRYQCENSGITVVPPKILLKKTWILLSIVRQV